MADIIIPVGVDSADGVTHLPPQPSNSGGVPTIVGTPIPTACLYIFDGSGTNTLQNFQEPPGYPKIERAEQCTCEHMLILSYLAGEDYLGFIGRGTIVTDTQGNIWRILSSDLTKMEATTAHLHYVMESISFDSPPDDFRITKQQLDIFIIKHPRYWPFLCPYDEDASNYISIGDTAVVSIAQIKECIIRMIQNYIESPFYPSQNQTNSLIQVNIIQGIQNGTFSANVTNYGFDPASPVVDPVFWDGNLDSFPDVNCVYFIVTIPPSAYTNDDPQTGPIHLALAAAQEIITKLWRQEDTPYLPGYEVSWSQYFFAPVYLNPGAYVEDPRDWVPQYFLSPDNNGIIARADQNAPIDELQADNLDLSSPPGSGGQTIFDYLAQLNPQCFSDDGTVFGNLRMSSLRLADDYDYERTWFKVTHTWLVAPVGKWDVDLFTGGDGPQVVSDFNKNPVTRSNI